MSLKSFAVAALFVGLTLNAMRASATVYQDKTIEVFLSPDTRECSFLKLDGVQQADSAVPGPWFAVPKTHVGYQEIVSILIQARATGKPLQKVTTTGKVVCGHAEVISLSF